LLLTEKTAHQHNNQSINQSINLFAEKYHINKTAKYSAPDRQDIPGSRGALTVALIIKKLKHYT